MNIEEYIKSKNLTKYRLSQMSGVPKTTLADICSGKSDLKNCSARTVQKLATSLDCSMEFLMSLEVVDAEYDEETGLPQNKDYLERNLPPYLQTSLKNMIASWRIVDGGGTDYRWDIYWCELNADINSAEVDQEISPNQAWYLREKYLRM